MGLVFHFIEFWCGGQTLFAAGLPILFVSWILHCMSSVWEDRRSFAAGLPTFRGECRVDSVPLTGFRLQLLLWL